MDNLLKDRGQGALGRFDTRQVGGAAPVDRARQVTRRTVINRYLRTDRMPRQNERDRIAT